ncbi:MAG: molybdopterin-dependent oxidoreductase [Cypionkella sp.]
MAYQTAIKSICAIIFSMTFAAAASAHEVVLDVIVGEAHHEFTLEDLQAQPVSTFKTSTIWTPGPQTFQGVSLKALLETLNVTDASNDATVIDATTKEATAIEATAIEATAINDYSVTIPLSDATLDGPIIAYFANGAPMSRRGKGPLWIVYPYDSDLKYQTETIYSRSIWQLDRLSVR